MKKIITAASLLLLFTSPCVARNNMGFGLNLGYEATYGNGISYHYLPNKIFELNGGIGYDFPAWKFGAGGLFKWKWNRHWGMRSGASIVYAAAAEGEVAVDAKFYPDGSSSSENIVASKRYEVSSSVIIGSLAGLYLNIDRDTQLVGDVTYNLPLTGNEVELNENIKFDKNIEASNQVNAEREFDQKAKEQAKTGGLGMNIGIRFLF